MDIQTIIDKVKSYNDKADVALLEQAYDYALKSHQGQLRLSGEDYIQHPLAVAYILAELELDVVTIVAAILHDVVEDTEVSLEEIEEAFGAEVALLVDGVTKLSKIEYSSKEEQHLESLRKMILAMAKDIRVIIIKLADRLHNMRTLSHKPKAKQKEKAKETLEIFAPLAHRLGIFRIRWELEDWSLRYLQPEQYYDLVKKISMRRHDREEYINEVIAILKDEVESVGVKADISGRPKHFYSIYNKMVKEEKSINEIFDLIAVRVIVNTIKDCYGVLGVVHALWTPIPGRFKDYIAMPKPNMYQSLHTTVIGPRGEPFEVQIRTWEMHRTSEYGIAAHWKYKESREGGDKHFEQKLAWLRQLLEWQREMPDAREFMESLKIDLFSDRVYVFTPKGDVVELPAGSVPIDFAYKVHTTVGHECTGAKVNNRIVPLDYELKTGDIVEIITSKGSGPSRDWLKLVQTSQAKNRIRHWFKQENRESHIIKGKELLDKEIAKQGLKASDVLQNERLLDAGKKFNLFKVDDVYAAVGDGSLTAQQIITKIKDKFLPKEDAAMPDIKLTGGTAKSSGGVSITGVGDVMVRLSLCCNPIPGDEIVGYITRGRGVSIHRTDCPNVIHYKKEEPHRIVEDLRWDVDTKVPYRVAIEVEAMDRPRLASDIMNVFAETKLNIIAINARAVSRTMALVDLKIEVNSMEQLGHIMEKIRRVQDVLEVRRVVPKKEK